MSRGQYRILAWLSTITVFFWVPVFQGLAHSIPNLEAWYITNHLFMDVTLSCLAALCSSIGAYLFLRQANAPLERLELGLYQLHQQPLSYVGDAKIDHAIRQINVLLQLEQDLVYAREKERLTIAQDLHDHVLQDLIAVRMLWVREEKIESLEALNQAILALRQGIQNIAPPELEVLGLVVAVEERAQVLGVHLSQNGLEHAAVQEALEIYRLIEHGLQNAVQHGRAKHVHVSYASGSLSIQDDGVGCGKNPTFSLGLKLCQAQMRLRGGDVVLHPLQQGSELKLWWNVF